MTNFEDKQKSLTGQWKALSKKPLHEKIKDLGSRFVIEHQRNFTIDFPGLRRK